MAVSTVYQSLIKRRLLRQGYREGSIELAGFELNFLEGQFDGPSGTLVLIHGLGSSALGLAPILKRVSGQFERVIAVDLLGHGENPCPEGEVCVETVYEVLSQQLLRLCPEAFTIFGSSLGGGLALRFAVENPERVAQIALTSPAGAPLTGKDIKRLRRLFDVDSDRRMKALVRALFHKSPWYGSLLGRELKVAMQRPMVRQILAQLEGIQTLKNYDLSVLTMPIMLIWGQSETLLPRHCLDWFQSKLPTHVYFEQPFGYGHSPHLESAEDLSARLLHFFRN